MSFMMQSKKKKKKSSKKICQLKKSIYLCIVKNKTVVLFNFCSFGL